MNTCLMWIHSKDEENLILSLCANVLVRHLSTVLHTEINEIWSFNIVVI